jgi:hypothetical protein
MHFNREWMHSHSAGEIALLPARTQPTTLPFVAAGGTRQGSGMINM